MTVQGANVVWEEKAVIHVSVNKNCMKHGAQPASGIATRGPMARS